MKTWTLSLLLPLLCSVLNVYSATYYLDENSDVVGSPAIVTIQKGDTLQKLALKHEMGLDELLNANPHLKTQKYLRINDPLVLPTHYILPPEPFREGIVINMPEKRLYFFHPSEPYVMIYPVAMGRSGWRTPLFSSEVRKKKADPTWHVPPSIRQYMQEAHGKDLPEFVPPGPENPLGKHAIYLTQWGILIHGTNQPSSIGRLISSGCIRMHNEHVESLFEATTIGMPVHVIHHTHKIGHQNGHLYLETHPPVSLKEKPESHYQVFDLKDAVDRRYPNRDAHLLPDALEKTNPTGLPQHIGHHNCQSC